MSPKKNKGGAHLQEDLGEKPPRAKKPPRTKTAKRPRTPMERALHVLFIVLTVLAALVVLLFIGYKLMVVKPNIPMVKPTQDISKPQESGGLRTEGPDTNTGDRKKDFFTFLVIGRDTGGGGNTDTIMLVAYDIPQQKLSVMSIPRDTMVNVPWDIKRINSVYNYGGGGDEGIKDLYTEVSQLVGFRPDYDIVVEWDAFGKLVDAIGGVVFDVPIRMDYNDPTQNLHINLQPGEQKLNGDKAMQLIRWRKNSTSTGKVYGGYPDGDIGRIKTQQDFMKAVIAQCLKADKIISNIGKYAQIFTECVETDLTVNNLAWFAEQAILGGLKMENVNFITLPGNYNAEAWSRSVQSMQSYVLPYGDELIKVVNESFNPYLQERSVRQLDVMSINKDGSLSSSTGTVEDRKATRPSGGTSGTKPAATPKPSDLPLATETPNPDAHPSPSQSPLPGETDGKTEPAVSPKPGTSTPPAVSPPPEGKPTPAPTPTPTPVVTAAPTPPPAEPTPPPADVPVPDPNGVILPPEA